MSMRALRRRVAMKAAMDALVLRPYQPCAMAWDRNYLPQRGNNEFS
jgi:hypothetical protein